MMQKNPSSSRKLTEIIKRYEAMKEENKVLYLDADQYADIVEQYTKEQRYTDAHEAILAGLKIHPSNTTLIIEQASLYIDAHKLKEAREVINTILNEKIISAQLLHIELLILEDKPEEADLILDNLKNEELDEDSCLDIAYLCIDVEYTEKAIYWIDKVLQSDSENEEALYTLCEYYQAKEKYDEAIKIFNRLLDKSPYSAKYWIGLAKTYFNLSQFDKAIEACDFSIVADEEEGEAYCIKAHSYYQLENYRVAIDIYKTAQRLKALDTHFASVFISFCYIELEEWENAYQYIERSITNIDENSPVYADLLLNAARCLYKTGKNKEAHLHCEIIQDRFPDYLNAYLYNGFYYLKENDEEKALENWEKAVQISPTSDTWSQIGLLCFECNHIKFAKTAFKKSRELNPHSSDTDNNLEYLLQKISEKKQISLKKESIDKVFVTLEALSQKMKNFTKSDIDMLLDNFDIDRIMESIENKNNTPDDIQEVGKLLEELNSLINDTNKEENDKI